MVRHAPIHRRSGHSDIAICCGRNVLGSSQSTSVVPLSNQVTTLNHKRFKGFKMFSDGHLNREWVAPCCRQGHQSRHLQGHQSHHRRLPPHSGHTHSRLSADPTTTVLSSARGSCSCRQRQKRNEAPRDLCSQRCRHPLDHLAGRAMSAPHPTVFHKATSMLASATGIL